MRADRGLRLAMRVLRHALIHVTTNVYTDVSEAKRRDGQVLLVIRL